MKLFGWKTPRDGARPTLSRAGLTMYGTGDWPQAYEAQLRAGYRDNAVGQRAVRLTSHDRDLVIDGLVHSAAPGMTPSAIVRADGLDANTMAVDGAFTSAAIGEADLVAGRWDGARVALSAIDWSDGSGIVALGEGTIGAVQTKDGAFTAELAGITAALDRPVVEETSAECRARLGDTRCWLPMAGRRRFAHVVAIAGQVLTLTASEPTANAYGQGRLRWFGGANAGLEDAIAASNGATVTLRVPPRFEIEPGVLVELVEGCDKSLATCAARFGNVLNFRGEPYLPGVDLLTRYPGG